MVEEVTMYKCPICKRQHPTKGKALACQGRCERIKEVQKKYPEVRDRGCDFANGGGWVQRTKEWYDPYMDDCMEVIAKNHPKIEKKFLNHTLNYGLMRILDDSGYDEYSLLGRLSSVCPKCFREWGQPYYAINCTHDGGTKLWGKPVKRSEWIRKG